MRDTASFACFVEQFLSSGELGWRHVVCIGQIPSVNLRSPAMDFTSVDDTGHKMQGIRRVAEVQVLIALHMPADANQAGCSSPSLNAPLG